MVANCAAVVELWVVVTPSAPSLVAPRKLVRRATPVAPKYSCAAAEASRDLNVAPDFLAGLESQRWIRVEPDPE